MADISADHVTRFANELQRSRSSRTVQAYLAAVKAFSKWLTQNEKLTRDPLASIGKPNPKTDRRKIRRMLLPDEWSWLRRALAVGSESVGITALERLLLYWTAIQTGLRSGELRSLTRGNLSLSATQPYLTCDSGNTKNRKPAKQYIGHDLAAALDAHAATKTPRAPLFAMPHRFKVAAMLRADLKAARELWLDDAKHDAAERARRNESDFLAVENHQDQRLDFHALRHTCGAWLALQGHHPKLIQTVMRPSTITLTMDTYGHLFPGQEADAASGMSELLAVHESSEESQQATGTDDQVMPIANFAEKRSTLQSQPLHEALRNAQRAEFSTLLQGATSCDSEESPDRKEKTRNPVQAAGLCAREQLESKRRARDSKGPNFATHCNASSCDATAFAQRSSTFGLGCCCFVLSVVVWHYCVRILCALGVQNHTVDFLVVLRLRGGYRRGERQFHRVMRY